MKKNEGLLGKKIPKTRRLLVVDDDKDLTFKICLEDIVLPIRYQVYAYNSPLVALLEFKTDFYHLLLVDINMPLMNGFELCEKILELDASVRVCFMSAGEINQEAIREVHSTKGIGCFIKKTNYNRGPR